MSEHSIVPSVYSIPECSLKIQETLNFKLSNFVKRHKQNMPDQKDKAQEKNRLERLQEEQGDTDAKHSGGAGASGGNSGAGKSGASKISASGTPDDIENIDTDK